MLNVKNYYDAVDKIAPFSFAESWDNVGLNVGDMEDTVTKVVLALDVTSKVIEEAVELGANLIISHHPLMFSPVNSLSSKDLVYKLAKNGIALIAAHTNLDAADGGVNHVFGGILELKNLEPVFPVTEYNYCKIETTVPESHAEAVYSAAISAGGGSYGDYAGCGFLTRGEGRFVPLGKSNPFIGSHGELEKVPEVKLEFPVVLKQNLAGVTEAIKVAHPYEQPSIVTTVNMAVSDRHAIDLKGELSTPMPPSQLAGFIKEKLNSHGVKFTSHKDIIKTVAICGGGGGEVILDRVIRSGVDAYITGEMKYDLNLKANEAGLSTFEAGHFQTETVVMPVLKKKLEELLGEAEILISKTSTDEISII